MKIKLTDVARLHLKDAVDQNTEAIAIRLGTKVSGCSGYSYVIEYAKHKNDGDVVLYFDGLTILIDSLSAPFLNGTSIDLVKNGFNKSLQFSNPNVVSECGCGESFAVGASVTVY